ncbi:MAG: hypothetical protein AB8B48_01745 [Pseudomonadales bacterium]
MGNYHTMQAANQNVHGINLKLLYAAIRFNSLMLGITGGVLSAGILYFATVASLAKWGDQSGNYLGLLAVFFPGYSVSPVGAWLGAFWGFVYASVFFSLSYRLYGRVLGTRIADLLLTSTPSDNPVLKPSILRLHGVSLGTALGAMAALGLFCSTSWLVLRGTAGESVHAALLSNYIPGYSVSFLGGLIGALQMFVVVFAGALVLAAVYNKVVEMRH